MKKRTSTKPDAYQIVADKIISMLESGVAPWRRPWATTAPMSMSSGKPYRGINIFLLMGDGQPGSNWWGTYKKISELGGQVRKGEKSTPAVLWNFIERDDVDANGQPVTRRVPLLRYYSVFSATQCDWPDGMPAKFTNTMKDHAENSAAQAIMDRWVATGKAPKLTNHGERAFYRPSIDTIAVPVLGAFDKPSDYYSTLFHEATHATGHASRLNRDGVADNVASFGSHTYGVEELIAEMGAAMLCGEAGITDNLEASASYINSWLTTIKEEPKMVVSAAAKAQRAVDLILGTTWEDPN